MEVVLIDNVRNRRRISIRDEMAASWMRLAALPTTLAYAADPIPHPPASWVKDGHAQLENIRKGHLNLLLELNDGRIFALSRQVDPAEPLILTVP